MCFQIISDYIAMISVFRVLPIYSGHYLPLKSGGNCLVSVWCIVGVPVLISRNLESSGHFVHRCLLHGLPTSSSLEQA